MARWRVARRRRSAVGRRGAAGAAQGRGEVEKLPEQFALTEGEFVPARKLRRERLERLLLELLEGARHERLRGLRPSGVSLPRETSAKNRSGFSAYQAYRAKDASSLGVISTRL